MRLLVLTHRLPFPPHKGEKIRALNVLKFLARSHEIHLASLLDDPGDQVHLEQLRPYARTVLHARLRPRMRKILSIGSLARSRSLSVDLFYSVALQRKVDDLIEHAGIQAVFCSSSPMAEYVFRSVHAGRLARIPRVMDLIDVDSCKWQQYAKASPRWISWVYRHEGRCLGAYEQRIAASFDRVLVTSAREKACFPGGLCPANVVVMGNGVDLGYFSPTSCSPSAAAEPSLVFTGVMDYRPNIDGILWFADAIWPAIRAAVPGVRLYVVGNRPTRAVRRLARGSGIVVTGFVADVREYLARAALSIAPLRIARGVQNKVLEAMAMGRPVVASRAAFEGVDAVPGRDLLVADDAASFAAAVIDLLQHPARRVAIGAHARACVERNYAWARNLSVLDELLPASAA